jgi:hypothetical protein
MAAEMAFAGRNGRLASQTKVAGKVVFARRGRRETLHALGNLHHALFALTVLQAGSGHANADALSAVE